MEWTLAYDGFDPYREGSPEALCTLGNGYFATRGAGEEAEADDTHYPGTYLAGGYNRLETAIAVRVVENEDLVNLPNWLPLTFRPEGGDWLNLGAAEILAYRQALDLRAGILRRIFRLRDQQGRETTLTSRRLVYMGAPHLAAIEWTLRPENWSGRIEILSTLDGRVVNAGVPRYRQLDGKHLVPLSARGIGEDAFSSSSRPTSRTSASPRRPGRGCSGTTGRSRSSAGSFRRRAMSPTRSPFLSRPGGRSRSRRWSPFTPRGTGRSRNPASPPRRRGARRDGSGSCSPVTASPGRISGSVAISCWRARTARS